MCRPAHIALEAREGLQLFEEPEYHDNLRGLESHECDKKIKDFWGFEKREGHEDSLSLLIRVSQKKTKVRILFRN